MNFALSDEQILLREAARGSLSRVKTVQAARDALEKPDALPDLWPLACEAGWPGLLISEEHGGAGLGAFEAHARGRGVRSRAGLGAADRADPGHRAARRGRRRVTGRGRHR